jgi:anti-sigma regulatory factor (Ser/Thr protein kinase)
MCAVISYPAVDDEFSVPLDESFSEDLVWSEKVKPLLVGCPENIINICAYGFTEMMNNANDHSGADRVDVAVTCTETTVTIRIIDLGVGIFHHILAKLGLDDVRHAVFELTKGKLTTDPDRHTGEGIFYTSRMFDGFALLSGDVFLGRTNKKDWLFQDDSSSPKGTIVKLSIAKNSTRTPKEVFDHYASAQDDYGFKKTIVSVSLAHEGKTLISRSQAKRVVARLDKFSEVVLDFEGIESISPAFADEIFRVFAKSHSHVRIIPINTNDDITKMIIKALADANATAAG